MLRAYEVCYANFSAFFLLLHSHVCINAGILQGNTLVPFTFIVCLDYVLRKSLDAQTDLGFTLTQQTNSRYPYKKVTVASYADEFAV